eukprot:scaffold8901_cov96-Amphora_coffeaeformis.AAC.1
MTVTGEVDKGAGQGRGRELHNHATKIKGRWQTGEGDAGWEGGCWRGRCRRHLTRYNRISYCECEPCERYISQVSFKQRCANIRSQFATEVRTSRSLQQRCARLGENIFCTWLFYYGTKSTKTTCVSKTMRWTAQSADVSRFKSDKI